MSHNIQHTPPPLFTSKNPFDVATELCIRTGMGQIPKWPHSIMLVLWPKCRRLQHTNTEIVSINFESTRSANCESATAPNSKFREFQKVFDQFSELAIIDAQRAISN